MYKIGLVYKRQDIFHSELMETIKNNESQSNQKLKSGLADLATGLSQLNLDLEENTERQRAFITNIVSFLG